MAIASINPATGQLVKSFEPLTDAQIEGKLKRGAEAFAKYRPKQLCGTGANDDKSGRDSGKKIKKSSPAP